MTTVLLACVGAAVLGPLTVALARWSMLSSWAPTRIEIASTVALAGTLCALTRPSTATIGPVWPLLLLGPAAVVVDAREGRLPNVLTLPLLAGTVGATIASTRGSSSALLLGAGAALGAAVLATAARGVLGWGDAKLIPSLVLVLASPAALAGAVFRAVALIGMTALVVGLLDRRSVVPYGPALLLGTLSACAGV